MAVGGGPGPKGRVQPWGAHSWVASVQTHQRGPAFPLPREALPAQDVEGTAPRACRKAGCLSELQGCLLQEALLALSRPVEYASRSMAPRTYVDCG